jgi:hypothetical protein
MLSNYKRLLLAGTLLLATTLGSSLTAAAQSWVSTFTVYNGSQYRIDHLYVSPNNDPNWGGDRLGRYVLLPGYRFDLPIIRGWYDVKLIDRDGDECIVPSVDFRNGDTWTITDRVLLVCESFSGN